MPCFLVTSGYHSHQPHLTPAGPTRRDPVTALARHCPPVRGATGHQAESNGTGRFHPGLTTNKSVQGALARCPVQVGLPRSGISRATADTAAFRPDESVTVQFTGTASTYPSRSFSQASRSLGAELIYLIAGHPGEPNARRRGIQK
jgi:hypothetical protein